MKKEVKLLLKFLEKVKIKTLNLVDLKTHKKLALLLLNLFIKSKVMMMMNGPHQLNSILSYLRSKNNFRKCENNNLRKRLKNNLINKCNKKDVKNKDNKNNCNNIQNYNNNKLNFMMKDKDKKNKIINVKLIQKKT